MDVRPRDRAWMSRAERWPERETAEPETLYRFTAHERTIMTQKYQAASLTVRDVVSNALTACNGVLPLEPAWVARELAPAGRRLGLPEDRYDVGARGEICERWLASTTRADNRVGPADEGLSYLALEGDRRITLREAVDCAGREIMGTRYAATHSGLGRLAKIFDYGARLPYHIHPRAEHASLVGRNPKEEAYFYPPGVDMGPHPETFFGVHPSIADEHRYDVLLPYLVDWNSDLILRHSRAYFLIPEDGFHVPAGVLHAPGSALTIELQEDSDTSAMFQALNAGRVISKELLFKDVRPEDRKRLGERFLLEWVDWPVNGDPYLYERFHLGPRLIESSVQPGGEEHWIYYNTPKFSGKKLTVRPAMSYVSVEKGVYSVLAWRGSGTIAGQQVRGGDPSGDEVLVVHDRATTPHTVVNTGSEDLVLFKFFGPDVNPDVPYIRSALA